MSKLSLQFHALPEEMGTLVSDLLQDNSVFMTVVEGSRMPLQFRLNEERLYPPDCRALIFTLSPPVLSAKSIHDFRGLNPDALVLEFGQLVPAGLTESWLSAITENKDVVKRWKQTVKLVQAATLGGAVAVNPKSGAAAPMKGHRFTRGAQGQYLKGVAMLPSAGNSLIQLAGIPIPD
jgi:hypothetical protein